MDPAFAQFGVGGLAVGVGAMLVRFLIEVFREDRKDLRELQLWVRDRLPAVLETSTEAIRDLTETVRELAGDRPPPRPATRR